jgi:hypothetical protein
MWRTSSTTTALPRFASEAAEHRADLGAHPGPFARNVRHAHRVGLVVIPTAADDAKRPLVRWGRLKGQPRLSTLEVWAQRFAGANLAYLPAPSGLLVVDVDDMAAEDRVRALLGLGDTPIVIASGRRGLHFPLRTEKPIPSLNLRRFGLVAEIKGARSIVVAPGSIHPETGRPYRFIRGDWDDFARAPLLDVQALEALIGRPIDEGQEVACPSAPQHNRPGCRNAGTFAHLLSLGAQGLFNAEREVIEAARIYNAAHNDPPEYVKRGTCRAPKVAGYTTLTGRERAALRSLGRRYADALALFLELKRAHGRRVQRGETFAIAAAAMAREQVIPGWTDAKRYLRAKKALLERALIVLAQEHVLQSWIGSDGKVRRTGRAAAQYRLARVRP